MWEINGGNTKIFDAYLKAFFLERPNELKVVVINNAGFHSTGHIETPDNIKLLNTQPYTPELNPCEQIWTYITQRYKTQTVSSMDTLKDWLHNTVRSMVKESIMSIWSNHDFLTHIEQKG